MDPALVEAAAPASEFRDMVVTALWGLAIPLLIGLIALIRKAATRGLALGQQWVESWTLSKVAEANSIGVMAAMDRIEIAAQAGMEAAEQTIVRHLRAAEPAGKLDAKQATAAMSEALAAARAHFGESMWRETGAALHLNADEVTALIRTKIEAALGRTKGAKPVGDASAIVQITAADESTVRLTVDGRVEPGDSGPAGASQR